MMSALLALLLLSPLDPWPVDLVEELKLRCTIQGTNLGFVQADRYCECFFNDLSERVRWSDFWDAMDAGNSMALDEMAAPSRAKCESLKK